MTTYSISLDDVDVALLPVRTRSNDFLKKDYYEFTIMARDGSTTDVHYQCHICALNVPAAYTREHWASVKHRANARIATVASKRMRALVSSPPIVPTTMTSGKFCEACSTIVGINHEKTKEHRIAVIHDRMLVDLMKIYVGNDGGFDDNDDDDKYDDDVTLGEARNGFTGSTLDITIDSDTKENKIKTVDENEKITNGDTNNAVVTPISEVNEAQVTIIEETTETIQTNDNKNGTDKYYMKIETETYIKLLGNFSGHSEIAFKAIGDKVQIAFNNECVEVSDDHFHSYYRLKGKVQCRVCCETLNINTEEAHKLTKIHMERVSAAVADSHCVRKIYDDWSHCIICNQVMKTTAVSAHNLTKYHYDRKNKATTKNTETNHPTKVENQTASTSKVFNTNSVPKQTFYPKMTVNTQNDKIEYPYKRTPNPLSVFCVVCRCEVPMKLSNRIDHLKGARHAHSMINANSIISDNA